MAADRIPLDWTFPSGSRTNCVAPAKLLPAARRALTEVHRSDAPSRCPFMRACRTPFDASNPSRKPFED